MTRKLNSGTLSTRRTADKKKTVSAKPAKEADVQGKARSLHGKGKLRISSHANQRMAERKVIHYELLQAFSNSQHEPSKDRFSAEHNTWEYSFVGKTIDNRKLRIGVAFELDHKTNERLLVVTVIDIT